MTVQQRDMAMEQVAADCDAAAVHDLHAGLQDLVGRATPESSVALDLTDGPPTAFAIQLLVAAGKSLDRRGAFAGFGPAARAALSRNG